MKVNTVQSILVIATALFDYIIDFVNWIYYMFITYYQITGIGNNFVLERMSAHYTSPIKNVFGYVIAHGGKLS